MSNQAYNPSVIPRSYSHSSDESETGGNGGGGGGTYGQPIATANHGYGAHSATNNHGPLLPPLREHPGQQAHTTRATDYGTNDYSFSGIQVPNDIGYQLNPTHSGHYHGTQPAQLPTLPPHTEDYYPGRSDSSPWNTSDLGFPPHQLTANLYSDEHNVLSGTPDLTRRGMTTRLPPQVHPGFLALQAQYWQQTSHNESPTYSSSPSPSTDGSFAFGNDHSPSHVPINLNSNDTVEEPLESIEHYLRRQCGFRPDQPLSLRSLPDPIPGRKLDFKLKCATALAIYESRHKKLTLQEIYKAFEDSGSAQKTEVAGSLASPYNLPVVKADLRKIQQSSIRHLLSLECIFVNDTRPIAEPGKGGYWSLTNKNGFGKKRPRKRLTKEQKDTRRRIKEEEDQYDYDDSYDDDFYDEQIEPSSGVQRSSRSSSHSSSPQLSTTTIMGRPMSNSPGPYDSIVAFGQPSLGPQVGHMRQYAQAGPSRTHSLPIAGSSSGGYRHLNRPATLPMPVHPEDYGSTQDNEDRDRRYRDFRHTSSHENAEVDDSDGSRRRASRRAAEKGNRRSS
ncbi:hypothetical protein DXG03_004090 [Asterophora parasitica]|uniref:Fork-head domain-containing protein n=1 Tax=Asterophora parasitica TaxID=117018 RepID=A0A9P7KBJ8_9AGAR|nr:hypothetical protein DXG03_004090 [Asterophora parasitica]